MISNRCQPITFFPLTFGACTNKQYMLMQRLRSRGGLGPPWNFQKHVNLPDIAKKRHKLAHFHQILSIWPPLSLRRYASADPDRKKFLEIKHDMNLLT